MLSVVIAVERAVVAVEGIDDPQGLLRGGRIVEVYQRVSVYLGVENGEL
jgi:hypothetical protein